MTKTPPRTLRVRNNVGFNPDPPRKSLRAYAPWDKLVPTRKRRKKS